jgi:hypothetical protein
VAPPPRGREVGGLTAGTSFAKRWIFSILESLPHDDFVKVLITLWAIWHARRKALHEQEFQGPFATYNFVNKYIGELGECKQKKQPTVPVRTPRARSKWIPPAPGLAKIRVDGAVPKEANEGTYKATTLCVATLLATILEPWLSGP